MTAVTKCDYCGRTVEETNPHLDQFGGWWRLDCGPVVYDICSLECMTGWLVEQNRRRYEATPVERALALREAWLRPRGRTA